MIVKIPVKFKPDSNCVESVMMFGNSYKKWDEQVREYFASRADIIESVGFAKVSKSEWIGWGGLKWCEESHFQSELDREGCQKDEPDNPAPRQYAEMIFIRSSKADQKIDEMLAKARQFKKSEENL